jgi:hypothetical protein
MHGRDAISAGHGGDESHGFLRPRRRRTKDTLERNRLPTPSPSECTAPKRSSSLDAGLLDEIHVDLAAVLLGGGVRLFDHLASTPVVLGNPIVVTGVGVTHLRYPVRTS